MNAFCFALLNEYIITQTHHKTLKTINYEKKITLFFGIFLAVFAISCEGPMGPSWF